MALNCKNFAVHLSIVLCQYINSFALPEISERGATAPLATPLNPPLTDLRTLLAWVYSSTFIIIVV